MQPARIYALADPRDGVARYVGRTQAVLDDRLKQHIWAARKGRSPRAVWLRSVLAAGVRPEIRLLEEVSPDVAAAAENAWIAALPGLVNVRRTSLPRRPRCSRAR